MIVPPRNVNGSLASPGPATNAAASAALLARLQASPSSSSSSSSCCAGVASLVFCEVASRLLHFARDEHGHAVIRKLVEVYGPCREVLADLLLAGNADPDDNEAADGGSKATGTYVELEELVRDRRGQLVVQAFAAGCTDWDQSARCSRKCIAVLAAATAAQRRSFGCDQPLEAPTPAPALTPAPGPAPPKSPLATALPLPTAAVPDLAVPVDAPVAAAQQAAAQQTALLHAVAMQHAAQAAVSQEQATPVQPFAQPLPPPPAPLIAELPRIVVPPRGPAATGVDIGPGAPGGPWQEGWYGGGPRDAENHPPPPGHRSRAFDDSTGDPWQMGDDPWHKRKTTNSNVWCSGRWLYRRDNKEDPWQSYEDPWRNCSVQSTGSSAKVSSMIGASRVKVDNIDTPSMTSTQVPSRPVSSSTAAGGAPVVDPSSNAAAAAPQSPNSALPGQRSAFVARPPPPPPKCHPITRALPVPPPQAELVQSWAPPAPKKSGGATVAKEPPPHPAAVVCSGEGGRGGSNVATVPVPPISKPLCGGSLAKPPSPPPVPVKKAPSLEPAVSETSSPSPPVLAGVLGSGAGAWLSSAQPPAPPPPPKVFAGQAEVTSSQKDEKRVACEDFLRDEDEPATQPGQQTQEEEEEKAHQLPVVPPIASAEWQPGTVVMIRDLVKAAHLNGSRGILRGWRPHVESNGGQAVGEGRWLVSVLSDCPESTSVPAEEVAIKPGNLSAVTSEERLSEREREVLERLLAKHKEPSHEAEEGHHPPAGSPGSSTAPANLSTSDDISEDKEVLQEKEVDPFEQQPSF